MAADTQNILTEATKLGQLVADHPATGKFKSAQKAVSEDAEVTRLLRDFDRTLETLGRQEQTGMPVTDAQRQSLESVQSQLMSHIKFKAMQMAQVDFVDLLRKISQTIQSKALDIPIPGSTAAGATAPGTRTMQ